MEAWCVRCNTKREVAEAQEVETRKRGGARARAIRGRCSSCGTRVWRFVG